MFQHKIIIIIIIIPLSFVLLFNLFIYLFFFFFYLFIYLYTYSDEDWMDDDDDHNDLLARFDAPSVNVKTEENPPSTYYNTAHSPSNHIHSTLQQHHNNNGHNGHNGAPTKSPYGWNDGNLAAPTPRGYNPNIMDATPKGNYAV